jgi:hypothetical protein
MRIEHAGRRVGRLGKGKWRATALWVDGPQREGDVSVQPMAAERSASAVRPRCELRAWGVSCRCATPWEGGAPPELQPVVAGARDVNQTGHVREQVQRGCQP